MMYISALLIIAPRSVVAYVFYFLASFCLIKISFKSLIFVFGYVVFTSLALAVSSLSGKVSVTAYLIEMYLFIPMVLFLLDPIRSNANTLSIIRLISVGLCLLSVANMMTLGFPARLPYIHYLPDAYGGLYGLGGAKVVTVLGFLALFAELYQKDKSKLYIILGILNFIVPNYLLGVFCGFLALGVIFVTNLRFVLLMSLPGVAVLMYALSRLSGIDNTIAEDFGFLPKIYAYYKIFEVYVENPHLILSGVGLGQYASTSALWASDYLKEISSHGIPNIPGFFMSSYHDIYLGEVLSILSDNFWALSSSFNKPYTSLATMFIENGFLFTFLFLVLIKRKVFMMFPGRFGFSLFVFILSLFLLDTWHDSLWLGYMLILIKGIPRNASIQKDTVNYSRFAKMRNNSRC